MMCFTVCHGNCYQHGHILALNLQPKDGDQVHDQDKEGT